MELWSNHSIGAEKLIWLAILVILGVSLTFRMISNMRETNRLRLEMVDKLVEQAERRVSESGNEAAKAELRFANLYRDEIRLARTGKK